jgi:hypothetical protein
MPHCLRISAIDAEPVGWQGLFIPLLKPQPLELLRSAGEGPGPFTTMATQAGATGVTGLVRARPGVNAHLWRGRIHAV